MKNRRFLSRSLTVLAAGAVALVGAAAIAAKVPEPPHCPDVYAPVLCSNGFVYANGCYASLSGQTNCVPYNEEPGSES